MNLNFFRNAMFLAIIQDRLTADRDSTPVVDDAITAGRPFRVGVDQTIHCRLVQIPVQAKYGDAFDWRIWQRVFEPTLQKLDLIVKQTVRIKQEPLLP